MQTWHMRRSPRLVGYDYSQPGLYFVTMCTFGREATLGESVADSIRLSKAGEAVQAAWQHLPIRYPTLDLDAFVVMPNHIHAIVILGADPAIPPGPKPPSLTSVMRAFKSISGIAGNKALGRAGEPFWQRSYHDRIIRNDRELALIRAYIADNPTCWDLDIDNPAAPGS